MLKEFVKKETVFVISLLLALVSMFFNPLGTEYLDNIDFRVLGILLGLMLIMSGFKRVGILDNICLRLLGSVKNVRELTFVLVMLSFFSSMLITNDVALVAFVPFAIYSLSLVSIVRTKSFPTDGQWVDVADNVSVGTGSTGTSAAGFSA